MSPLDFLFDPSLIPESIKQDLGDDLTIRPLASSDHARGHLDILAVLTVAPQLSPEVYGATFDALKAAKNTYFTVVIVQNSTDKIVASGSVVLERKFLRSAGTIGHIEDIAVSKSMQGRKLGIKLINALDAIGQRMGCYKIILDCSKDNIPFYEKCGYTHKEFQMVRYFQDQATPLSRL
ncbi:acyl-CoA N-acyltransferase [Papiliotrema laurentii]|uniref:Glucosamine 6-phosphate N-acetyltransferase n=1 Tax=Papiliotrema laurentii TaxID=5418 RepID=A0AAD9CUU8_PAPLA|nr:acyl-CoA N-acyltransferase [Papiliotrema laurentii]